jgi:hypothetical protein
MTSPTTSADARLPSRESIVAMLLEIAKTAHRAMDDGCDDGEYVRLDRDQAQALSDALDALDELPEPPTDTFGPGPYVANYGLTQHAEAGAGAGVGDRVEVRTNADGSLDEIVGTGQFHIEQMHDGCWFVALGPHMVTLNSRGKITANVELNAYGPESPRPTLPPPPGAGEDRRALIWLAGNDCGMSSTAICHHMLGMKSDGSYPYDPADLGRCLRLLELFPEWKPRIGEMAKYSKGWERIAGKWDELAALMAEEVGIDWSKGRTAPRTYAAMHGDGNG